MISRSNCTRHCFCMSVTTDCQNPGFCNQCQTTKKCCRCGVTEPGFLENIPHFEVVG